MLEKEEARIMKKIDSTRDRASQIKVLKDRNEEQFLRKIESKKKENQDLENKKRFIHEMRMNRVLSIEQNRNQVFDINHDSFVNIKHEQLLNDQKSKMFKESVKKYNHDTKR